MIEKINKKEPELQIRKIRPTFPRSSESKEQYLLYRAIIRRTS